MMNICMKKYACLALLVCGGMTFQAGAADSTLVTFNMSVPNPTCNINITGINNGTMSLGELKYNSTDVPHSSFTIKGDCGGYVGSSPNYINASLVRGGELQNDHVRVAVQMDSNQVDKTAGPFLKFKANNADVHMGLSDKFCQSSNGNIQCAVTPYTTVLPGAPSGNGSVVIRFTVNYQA